jgi:hypothetical protein
MFPMQIAFLGHIIFFFWGVISVFSEENKLVVFIVEAQQVYSSSCAGAATAQ